MPCPIGQYYDSLTLEQCVNCPSGYYGTDTWLSNPPSEYCNGYCGAAAGKYCESGGSSTYAKTSCPAGTFCPGYREIGTFTSCPAGFFGSAIGETRSTCSGPCTASSGYACPSNSINAAGSLCPDGYYCTGGSSSARLCDVGRYGVGGNSMSSCNGACAAAAGFTCNTSFSNASFTRFFQVTSASGMECPAGYFCLGGTHIAKCPAGMYSEAGFSMCSTCIASPGTYCPTAFDRDVSTSATGMPCPKGYYCPGDGKRYLCQGSYSNVLGASVCTGPCLPGYYGSASDVLLSTNSMCTRYCPKNTYCPIGTTTPIRCGDGSLSNEGSTRKLDCHNILKYNVIKPVQFFVNDNSNYNQSLSTVSIQRPFNPLTSGPFTPSVQSSLTDLIVNNLLVLDSSRIAYVKTGLIGTPAFPPGDIQIRSITQNYDPFTQDTQSVYAYTVYFSMNEKQYINFMYLFGGESSMEVATDYMFYSLISTNIFSTIFYNSSYANPSVTNASAQVFSQGNFLNYHPFNAEYFFDTQLGGCPAGYFAGLQTFTGEGGGLLTEYVCFLCRKGTFKSTTSLDPCTLCGVGYYGSDDGMTESTCSGPCEAGYYGSSAGLSVSTCSGPCARGYYGSSTGLSVSTCSGPCRMGYYGSSPGQTVSTCTGPCIRGYYGSSSGLSLSTCSGPCQVGYYGSSTGLTVPTCSGPCLEGYYGSSAGLTVATCSGGCQAGYFGSQSGLSVSTCNGPCAVGYFGATSGLKTRFCSGPCSKGYYGSSSGLSVSTCSGPCGIGFYGDTTGLMTPQCSGQCPRGYYGSSAGLSVSTCSGPCPVGYYGSSTGLSVSTCSGPCPMGFFGSSSGMTTSVCSGACRVGYYGSVAGLSVSTCSGPCQMGFYGSESGLSVSTCNGPCSAGYYGSTSGLTTRFCSGPCQTGYYGSETGLVEPLCNGPCDIGYYGSTPGQTSKECSGPCDAGSYGSEEGMTTSTCSGLCPPGYFGSIPGLTTDFCSGECEAGYYGSRPGMTNFTCEGRCPADFYCWSATVNPEPCPPTFQSRAGSKELENCVGPLNCLPGSYSGSGFCKPCSAGTFGSVSGLTSVECGAICPVGFYCPRGTINPLQCPEKYGGPGLTSILGCTSQPPFVPKENWFLLILVLVILGLLLLHYLYNKQTDFLTAFDAFRNRVNTLPK